MPTDMSQFHEIFFDEAAENLATLESLLFYLDPAAPDAAQLDDLARAAHNIKGACATFGFREMAGVAEEIEATVARARRDGTLPAAAAGDLREACALSWRLLDGYRGAGAAEPPGAAARAIALLRSHAEIARGAKVSPRSTAREGPDAAMALVEAAATGGDAAALAAATAAVRRLGEAIERQKALAGEAADNAARLDTAFRDLVRAIAGLALAPAARPRPLPKVRRARGGPET
jgi:chemotaxis protein histidine kinase CheA